LLAYRPFPGRTLLKGKITPNNKKDDYIEKKPIHNSQDKLDEFNEKDNYEDIDYRGYKPPEKA
jgi:hypothetical protein